MDESKLFALAAQLNQLTAKYTAGQVKHHTYATDYDKLLEHYGFTKAQLIAALAARKKSK